MHAWIHALEHAHTSCLGCVKTSLKTSSYVPAKDDLQHRLSLRILAAGVVHPEVSLDKTGVQVNELGWSRSRSRVAQAV